MAPHASHVNDRESNFLTMLSTSEHPIQVKKERSVLVAWLFEGTSVLSGEGASLYPSTYLNSLSDE